MDQRVSLVTLGVTDLNRAGTSTKPWAGGRPAR